MLVRYLTEDSDIVGFELGYPEENKDTKYTEFSCKFKTFGLEENISGAALGVDSVDALINAMMRLDIFLKSSKECKQKKIRWVGGSASDDFGLPWQSAKREIP